MNINDMTACERMAAKAWWDWKALDAKEKKAWKAWEALAEEEKKAWTEWKALDAEAARCMKMQREDEKITAAKRS